MGSMDDDEDSNVGSSDNDNDDTMEDMDDADNAGDLDADGEGDGGDMDENDENDDDDDGDDTQSRATRTEPPSRQNSSVHIPTTNDYGPSPGSVRSPRGTMRDPNIPYQPTVRLEAIEAPTYDIVPTIAAPHSTSINAITATPDMRWVFSGGADGWVRKFHWPDTVNGKTLLTVAQRHLFVDSVTKAGVLLSYWENEETPYREDSAVGPDEAVSLSPVYSLAVQQQGLWVLSGTESGVINVQSVRHEEGKRITSLNKHMSAVSCLRISDDEQSLLSGSWDKTVIDWDLNTGKVKRTFTGSVGQISALEMRPHSTMSVPQEESTLNMSDTFTTNTFERTTGMAPMNGVNAVSGKLSEDTARKSPTDSLFDAASLFGDDVGASPMDFSRQLEEDVDNMDNGVNVNVNESSVEEPQTSLDAGDTTANGDLMNGDFTNGFMTNGDNASFQEPDFLVPNGDNGLELNGLPLQSTDDTIMGDDDFSIPFPQATKPADLEQVDLSGEQSTSGVSENVFLDAAIDGALRIWDRRQQTPVTRILPSRQTPPWCMHACWSPDGNHIYAGRRNGTVDEYSLHKTLKEPTRTLRFPGGSGAVSAVRAMPNSKHLVCASYDILRLYDLKDEEAAKHSRVPFLIVPGHRTGVVSHLFIDPTCNYMISTAGNRGWEGASAEVLLGYEIGIGR